MGRHKNNGPTNTKNWAKNLANAIVMQAVQDYLTALRTGNLGKQQELENFFRSDWYNTLTKIDGEYLIRKCHEMDEERRRKRNGRAWRVNKTMATPM